MNKYALSAALLPLSLVNSTAQEAEKEKQPNIIFILADDLGIGDLGCYGQERIKTPGIDALAAQGMIFRNHYSGSTVSAPSRCVLMTGKHTGHSAIRGNRNVPHQKTGTQYDHPLPDEEITVAELLKQKGYSTACIGKWGMGGPESEGHPNNQGFDYFFGYLGQARAHRYYPDFIWENGEQVWLNNKEYTHDLIARRALEFVDRNSDRPFFLYMTPTIPHADLDVPELGEYDGMFEETPFAGIPGSYKPQMKPRATYAAMVSRLDRDVARLMELLHKKGIADNTIVIFSSDNGIHAEGGHDPDYFDSNSIFRGTKRDLYDGGVHTPFIVHWPTVIPAGSATDHISSFWDFLPTVCDIVGIKVPEATDGISYLPTLEGRNSGQKEHEYLYYEFHERGGKRSIMKDGWKLVELDVNKPETTRLELYNMKEDPSETKDLASEYPALVRKLKKRMYRSRTTNPVWKFRMEELDPE